MKVSINLSALFAEFSKCTDNVYLCNSIRSILLQGPLAVNGELPSNVGNFTNMLHSSLAVAYPKVFFTLEETSRRILDLWIRSEYITDHHHVMNLDGKWFSYTSYSHDGEVRDTISIWDDYKFKCALMQHLIEVYGDCEIVMVFGGNE